MSHSKKIRVLVLLIALLTVITLSACAAENQSVSLPRIHILATGGTIAGVAPSDTDLSNYRSGTLGVQNLIDAVPEISQYAQVTGEQFTNIDSDQMTPEIWLNLSRRVNTLLNSSDVDGIVITHGTDTLEETAYFLNLVTKSEKPVVITGSMRPATAISADGPLNLLDAVRLAGSPDARGKGVLIALNGEINGARDTTKTNTAMVETFRSPDFGLLGYMDDGEARFYRISARNHTSSTEFEVSGLTTLPRVDIVAIYPGMDTTAIDAFVAKNTSGIVISAMGKGGLPAPIYSALYTVSERGIPIIITSRTGTGIASGGGGVISGDTLTPQKARILLMLALTKTQNIDQIDEMFQKY